MCFTIHVDHIRKKIAKEDIICYKHIFIENMSLIYDFQYEIGVTNPKIKLVKLKTIIEGGYHSYDNPHVESIFLSYVTHSDQVIKLATFKIPKGTGYYYNPVKHEYVSETIIML
jgi:hypothetical protein